MRLRQRQRRGGPPGSFVGVRRRGHRLVHDDRVHAFRAAQDPAVRHPRLCRRRRRPAAGGRLPVRRRGSPPDPHRERLARGRPRRRRRCTRGDFPRRRRGQRPVTAELRRDHQPGQPPGRLGRRRGAPRRHRGRLAMTGPAERNRMFYVDQAYAALRERAGHGETYASAASEFTTTARRYDRVIAISRSGTTTEVLAALDHLGSWVPTVAICADRESPTVRLAAHSIVLDYADERSVVQTRFATTTLALL